MPWRLHLSNQTIHRLDILSGSTPLLAVWLQRARVYFFDLEIGAQVGERVIAEPDLANRQDGRWRDFMAGLTAPNRTYLPLVRAARNDIYVSTDGRMRLYHAGQADLRVEVDGHETALEVKSVQDFLAVDMDRYLGLACAVDDQGRLHLFQQQTPAGIYETGLRLIEEIRPTIGVTHGGGTIFISDGQQIVQLDSSGQVRSRLATHYPVNRLGCSPNGRWLATGDTETNVIRIYNGTDLAATHQRHADDLLAQADALQLFADPPPPSAALNTLAINNKGDLAFALAGVICVTSVEQMNAVPRPQRLA